MTMLAKLRLAATGLFTFAIFSAGAGGEVPEKTQLSVLTNIVPRMLTNFHYKRAPFDDAISSLTFDEYFLVLDPGKVYFTAEDIARFEPYREKLDDLSAKGDSHFAFEVYDLYRERVKLYREFAETRLRQPFDFTADETVKLDRRKERYCANLDELKTLWEKKLKSEVLTNRLYDRVSEYEKSDPRRFDGKSEEEKAKILEQDKLAEMWKTSPEERVKRRLHDMTNVLEQNDDLTVLALFLAAISLSYGPHTSYMAPAADENFDIQMKLSLCGIGATLTSDDGFVKVVDIVPGSPAAKEGSLHAGDRIIMVAQQGEEPVNVVDMALDRVVKMIRGEEGSVVTLTVLPGREGRGAAPRQISIERGVVQLKDSEAKGKVYSHQTADGEVKIGVIKLDSFYMDFDAYASGDENYKSCSRDVARLLDEFNASGVDAVVMDLRNNGGGSLAESIALSGLFIEAGPVVQVRTAGETPYVDYDDDGGYVAFTGPMVILTSRLTASASEIFSGAMKDYNRALLMGDSRTFGKGTVLQVTKLDRLLKSVNMNFDAGSLGFEAAVFYRVNGESTQARGIASDIAFPSYTENMEIGEEFSRNYLPWDAIRPVKHALCRNNAEFSALKDELARRSRERLASDPKYLRLAEKVAKAAETLKSGEISLNEEARFNEYLENRDVNIELDEETEYEYPLDLPEDPSANDKDLLLNEALNVLADWVELERAN